MAPDRALRTATRDKVHARPDLLVAEMADDAWAILTSAELQACGLTRNGIARRRRDGHLHLLHRGVYAVGHPTPPWQGRLLAAAKACGPEASAARFSSGALWGFIGVRGGPRAGGPRRQGARAGIRGSRLPPYGLACPPRPSHRPERPSHLRRPDPPRPRRHPRRPPAALRGPPRPGHAPRHHPPDRALGEKTTPSARRCSRPPGERVVRITYRQALLDPGPVIERIRSAGAPT